MAERIFITRGGSGQTLGELVMAAHAAHKRASAHKVRMRDAGLDGEDNQPSQAERDHLVAEFLARGGKVREGKPGLRLPRLEELDPCGSTSPPS